MNVVVLHTDMELPCQSHLLALCDGGEEGEADDAVDVYDDGSL
jgi:hypothetical protein